ncbi:MAG TPA: type VI secretion system contractile sheath large subunit, partial [Candidatus Cybelea sp.]
MTVEPLSALSDVGHVENACSGHIARATQDAPHGATMGLLIDQLIAMVDDLVTEQVNAVIHHPKFQALEASWRSIHRLAGTAALNPRIKLRVL